MADSITKAVLNPTGIKLQNRPKKPLIIRSGSVLGPRKGELQFFLNFLGAG
jgi:hypothetical protein